MMFECLDSILSSLLGEREDDASFCLMTSFGKVLCGQMAIQVAESDGNKGTIVTYVLGGRKLRYPP